MSKEQLAPNAETMAMAFQEAKDLVLRRDDWLESMDNKIVAVFSFAAAVAALATGFTEPPDAYVVLALCAFAVTAALCIVAYWPRKTRVSPDPRKIRKPAWLAIEPAAYQLKRLDDLGKDFHNIRQELERKARLVAWAMATTAAEVVLFGLGTL